MKKIIFFDIDGTLLGSDGKMSANVRKAILKTKQNGNRICLASGRSKGGLPTVLQDIPWDGLVLGNGAYGIYRGQVVTNEQLDQSAVSTFIDYTEQMERIGLVLENHEGAYLTGSGEEVICQEIKPLQYTELAKEFTVIDDLRQIREVNKMMYFGAGKDAVSMIENFTGWFDFYPNSIIQGESQGDGEVMKKGITKAWGIQKMISDAGYGRQDVVAFGDGYNDIEMIEYAGVGVAMGNGVSVLKKKADLITDTQEHDGICQALTILKLI